MACECDVKTKIEKDYAKDKEAYESMLEIVQKFQRGTKVFAVKQEKDQIILKQGSINSVTYTKSELTFSVRRCELDGNTDFTISTKQWKLFENSADMLEYVGTIIDPQPVTE